MFKILVHILMQVCKAAKCNKCLKSFYLRKIEIQFCFCFFCFLLWRSRSLFYQLEPTVSTAYEFLETFSDVIDGALTAHTF